MIRLETEAMETPQGIKIETRKVQDGVCTKEEMNVIDLVHKLINFTCKSIMEEVNEETQKKDTPTED